MGQQSLEIKTNTLAIIVAGGRGTRMARSAGQSSPPTPKQYEMLGDQSILNLSVSAFTNHPEIDQVMVVIHQDDVELYKSKVNAHPKLMSPITGGNSRQESVYKGLLAAKAFGYTGITLIHDAARPFVTRETISAVCKQVKSGIGAIPAHAISDTLKQADNERTIIQTIPRKNLYGAQTPQGFIAADIIQAHEKALRSPDGEFTDDASIIEAAGMTVNIIASTAANFKITTFEDLTKARSVANNEANNMHMDIRTGNGYDVHAFEPGDGVILCGLKIPYHQKLKGHSDADVALHALTDALLGCIGAGDIGTFFPPSDPQWKNAASDQFLQAALAMIADKGGLINNLDVTLICEAPKIGPHRMQMREQLAKICTLDIERVSVKATTNEKLGFIGRQEGIAAIASATVSFGVRT